MNSTPTHAASWFEIPVRDLDRAQRFYEAVLERPLQREAMGPETTLAVFPYAQGQGAGGCVLLPRVELPDGMGAFVRIEDSEGNRVGLHAAT